MQRAAEAPWIDQPGAGRLRYAMLLGALVIVYFFAGKLGLHFAFVHASASAVWPPTGIALGAALLFGFRVWPAIFIGAFLVNVTTSGSTASSLGISAGNTLEALVGAHLVSRYANGVHAFDRAQDFVRFALLAGVFSTAISATIGVTSLAATGQAAWSAFGAIWLTWWLGDAAGALVVAPLLVLWGTSSGLGHLRERPREASMLLFVVVAMGALIFMYPGFARYSLAFLCIPPLIWAAFRFGQREVATLAAALAAIATWATVRGSGPFAMLSDHESLLLLQGFVATMVALTMPVAALVWERKAIEDERSQLLARERAARAEAEAANRAKDEFLAMLSHELRNPLAAIANAAQVLQSPGPQPNFASRAVDIIDRQTRHLSRLIEDLLDVARVTSGKIALAGTRVNLAEVAQASVAVLRTGGRLDRHQVAVQAAPVWVEADPARLSQIVDNLLLNAIKYTPAGGHIEVRTFVEGDDAVLCVGDDGVGIARALLPHVFDLFIQGPRSLDRAQGGLGVGLTLAHRLVQAHRGRIDADGREALRMQLMIAGHEVFEAVTGDEGIEAAARVKPEIVLLDIGLPGLDGYQVARQLKASNGRLRLIAITGYGQPSDRERAFAAGIDQHLVKPVDPAELRRLLR